MANKKIFLLGATGQIGKELSYEFKDTTDIEIVCNSRVAVKSSFFNFYKIKNVIGELNEEKVISEIKSADLIFELSAPNSGTLKEIKNFYKKRANIIIPNMKKKSKFVFASTMNAFGMDKKRKKLKNYFFSSSIYASNKRFAENYFNELGKKNNIEIYNLRLAEVHGKFQRASINIIKLIEDKRIFELPVTPAWITFVSLIKKALINIVYEKEKPGLYTFVCNDIFWPELLSSLGKSINIKPKYFIKDIEKSNNKILNFIYKILSSYKDIFRGNFEISKNQEELIKLNYRINKIRNTSDQYNELKIYKEYNRYVGILPGKRMKSLNYKKNEILLNLESPTQT